MAHGLTLNDIASSKAHDSYAALVAGFTPSKYVGAANPADGALSCSAKAAPGGHAKAIAGMPSVVFWSVGVMVANPALITTFLNKCEKVADEALSNCGKARVAKLQLAFSELTAASWLPRELTEKNDALKDNPIAFLGAVVVYN